MKTSTLILSTLLLLSWVMLFRHEFDIGQLERRVNSLQLMQR